MAALSLVSPVLRAPHLQALCSLRPSPWRQGVVCVPAPRLAAASRVLSPPRAQNADGTPCDCGGASKEAASSLQSWAAQTGQHVGKGSAAAVAQSQADRCQAQSSSSKTPMTPEASAKIQSSQAKAGRDVGKGSFAARAQSAAARNQQSSGRSGKGGKSR